MSDHPHEPPVRCAQCQSILAAESRGVCLRCLGELALVDGSETPGGSTGVLDSPAPRPSTPTTAEPGGPDSRAATPPRRLGAYELIEEIGRGGMGVVYAAHHRGLDRLVAIKVIAGGAFASAEQETRFTREAQAAARLRHPGIVRVLDVNREGPWLYYAMDLLEGGDLRQATADQPLDARLAAAVMADVAEALEHAHAQGIIHRDLKPSNILLDAAGRGCVADFGLAYWELEPTELTRTGQVLGTPAFMAPEQAGGTASAASDIYGIGAVLYFALTGRPPIEGRDLLDLLARSAREAIAPPSQHVPGIAPALDAVCLRCLDRDPAARYPSARAVAEDLRRWLADGTVETPLVGPAEARRLVAEVRTQVMREGYLYHLVDGYAERLNRAAQLAPELADAHAELAYLHSAYVTLGIDMSQARRDLARQSVLRAEDADAANPHARGARAIYLLNVEGRSEDGMRKLAALVHERPDDQRLQALYSRACIKLGRWSEAKVSLRHRILNLGSAAVIPTQLLAYVHCHLREYADAAAWMEEALRLDPKPLYRRLTHVWYRWLADPEPGRALRELRAFPAEDRSERVFGWCEVQMLLAQQNYAEAFAVYSASFDTMEGFAAQRVEENALLVRLARWAGDPRARALEDGLREQLAPGRRRTIGSPKEGLQHAYAAAVLGERDEALALADAAVAGCTLEEDAIEAARNAGANEFYTAPGRLTILAVLGEADRFFSELERWLNVPAAVDPRALAVNPTFEALRRDPRYGRIMAGVQIPIVASVSETS